MIEVSYDESLNAFLIHYKGDVTAQHAEELYSNLLALIPQQKKGFRVLVDLSNATSVSPGITEALNKIMDLLNIQGVKEIIRIVPDPMYDVGLNIMSAFHYSKEVKLLTLTSRKEADKRIQSWKIKSKIAFVEMTEDWQKTFIKRKLPSHDILFFEKPAHECVDELKDINILSVFINSKVSSNIISKLPHLESICTRSTGFDHIDLAASRTRKISVFNVPIYGENTVAEHTFALILSLSRNLRKAYLRTSQNNFKLDGLMGFDLKDKTLGIIGTGHIGLHVIRMALGFGMKVIAYDVKKQNFLSEILNFEYTSLENLLERSDIISLHAPYLPGTHHMINRNNIGFIKKGAVLVNTARGGLIETDALIEALDKKILSGVGLDVLENEDFLFEENRLTKNAQTEKHLEQLRKTAKNHALLQRENVIFTPHMAFYSYEAVQRILETTIKNISDFLNGCLDNELSPKN